MFTLRPFSTTCLPRTLFLPCHRRLWRIQPRRLVRRAITFGAFLPLRLESRQIDHSHPPRQFLLFWATGVIHMLFGMMIVSISRSMASRSRSAGVVTAVGVERMRRLESRGTSSRCSLHTWARHGCKVSRRRQTVMHRTKDVSRRRVQRKSTVVRVDRYLRQRDGRMSGQHGGIAFEDISSTGTSTGKAGCQETGPRRCQVVLVAPNVLPEKEALLTETRRLG